MHRRPRHLRADRAGGVPVRPVVAHDPAQAGELPRRVRGLRHRGGRRVRRARRRAAARRRRHRPPPRQDRGGDRRTPRRGGDARAGESLAELVWSHAPSRPARAPRSAGDIPAITPESTALSKEMKRRGFRFVGPDDRLRGHAGVRHRQRSPRRAAGSGQRSKHYPRPSMDERALTERLITYDTSTLEGMQAAAGFVKGWLEARDVEVIGDAAQRPACPDGHGRPRERPDHRAARAPGRGAGPPRAVRAARGRRPALRPRRLRHEGRPRGDDLRVPRRGRPGGRARALRVRVGRGVRGDRRPRLRLPGRATATSATSPSRASPPTSTSASRRRACSQCASRSPARPRTAPLPGSATTRC